MADKLRIAVVSPFLDRRHGTERCIVEQIERIAREPDCEIHLYAQQVEDLQTARFAAWQPGAIVWHRVSSIPGPHLLRFIWWLLANRFARWRDAKFRGFRFDLVYSPGVNCFDADAVTVHACFSSLEERSRSAPAASDTSFLGFVRRLHRKLYYFLLARLERSLYSRQDVALASVSRRTARELERRFGRSDVRVIPNAVDLAIFHPALRLARRNEVRRRFGYAENDFVALLIGNDWRMKGLPALLEAVAYCRGLPLRLLVVGEDDRRPYVRRARELGVGEGLRFAPTSADVLGFYAVADAYVAPSLEDSFNLPVLEAMACGLPIVVSSRAGVSEWIQDGVNGVLLKTPEDPGELSTALRRLVQDPAWRCRLGDHAVAAAKTLTWGRNTSELRAFLETCVRTRRDES